MRPLRRDRAAVTSIEYALMGALVSLAIIGGVAGYSGSLGSMMNATFLRIASAM
jgi:Flp pilus assembly pilin Flp